MREDLIERLRVIAKWLDQRAHFESEPETKASHAEDADTCREAAAALEAAREDAWRVADAPPEGEMGFWTKDVITVSNYGTACTLAYFHAPDGGAWQRPSRYCRGEEVMMWRPIPAIDQARGGAE